MIGARKIDDQTDDLKRLYDLFDLGLNNSQIERIYTTNSGESLSRTHISQIRRGGRWNINTRSFLMKNEIESVDKIESVIDGVKIKTVIGQVISDSQIYHIYLTYVDGKLSFDTQTSLVERKPSRFDLIHYHQETLNDHFQSNSKI